MMKYSPRVIVNVYDLGSYAFAKVSSKTAHFPQGAGVFQLAKVPTLDFRNSLKLFINSFKMSYGQLIVVI